MRRGIIDLAILVVALALLALPLIADEEGTRRTSLPPGVIMLERDLGGASLAPIGSGRATDIGRMS
ncbi:hypothetical protein LX81_01413 [Palleronia aestuarii]|uniref:Uncharacterized protein n=1 Tax=Palleronia aestuarii TaxID=568105 RepID=A0A2W7NWK4_9RHOB|nr:hypothetical protein [Palleronia aestuarii]PZX17686.1 hypothetical protein LX81_01413 [Palleronia aestuarii]